MKQALQIFKQDIGRLLRNWAALLVVGGVCLLPCLYAWFNIAANMDPYGNTKAIRVAIANEDVAAQSGDVSLHAGDSIVAELKENDQLGWCFVDREQAIDGVRAGTYYAAIVIPADFSQRLLGILSGSLEQPQLDYYVNDKTNAVAPKITDTGVDTVQKNINDTFTSVASKEIATALRTAADRLATDVGGANTQALASIADTRTDLAQCGVLSTQFQTVTQQALAQIAKAKQDLTHVQTTEASAAQALAQATTSIQEARTALDAWAKELLQSIDTARSDLKDIAQKADAQLGALDTQTAQADEQLHRIQSTLEKLREQNAALRTSLDALRQALPTDDALAQQLDTLAAQEDTLNELLDALQAADANLQQAAQTGQEARQALSTLTTESEQALQALYNQLEDVLIPQINKVLTQLAALSTTLSTALESLAPTLEQLQLILDQLSTGLTASSAALHQTQTTLTGIDTQLSAVSTDLQALESSAAYRQLLSLEDISVSAVSTFMYSPVSIQTEVLYPVKNYGSAMTPFYTNLALWVGGLILASIFKQEVAPTSLVPHPTPTQAYFGRWLLFVLLGMVQGFVTCLGDLLLLKIQCVHPVAFVCAGVLCSFVYVNFVYALAIAFKHIGKAIAVILVIWQIPGSSGIYPIQMTPVFFQRLYPLLPFTYGINAMREAIAGMYGNAYAENLGMVSLYLPISFLIGLGLRPLLMNVNVLFGQRLAQSELLVGETDGDTRVSQSQQVVLHALLRDEAGKQAFERRAARFEARYPKLIRGGLLCILVIPTIFLALLLSLEWKLVCLVLWVTFMIALAVYLICVEYIHSKLQQQLALQGLTTSDLLRKLRGEAP